MSVYTIKDKIDLRLIMKVKLTSRTIINRVHL